MQRTLILMALQVPLNFAAKPLGGTGTGLTANIPAAVFNARLAIVDVQLYPEPVLAESLPRLNTDTWRIFPDGTMETTYRLKPNLTWHDGQPLAADDFVFASQVYATPAYGVAATVPVRSISEVSAPDPRTVVVRWSQRYVDAGILEDGLPPLPRHLLEEAHRESSIAGADSPSFLPNSSFWSSQYIGAGPYRLDVYNPGVSVEASAFDGYVLGRPRIDRVSVGGIADANTALATMLAGEAHMSFNQLWGEPAEVLAREWGTTGGTILWNPGSPRGFYFQFRPERAQPPELATDVRVRRAIAHAIDRRPIFETAANGRGVVSDTHTLPGMDIYPLVEREVAKYPHDPRRVHQLLEEAGFGRGSDGKWTTPRGVLFETTTWYTSGSAAFEHESTILVDQLNRVGIAAVSRSFNTRSQSAMERALLPGLILANPGTIVTRFHSRDIPTAEKRWVGSNRGAYSNPELDRLADAFDVAIEPAEITQLTIEMEKIVKSDLPGIFLFTIAVPFPHVAALKGPMSRWNQTAESIARNIHEWYWDS